MIEHKALAPAIFSISIFFGLTITEAEELFAVASILILCVLYGTFASYLNKPDLNVEFKEICSSSAFILILFRKASLSSPELD